MNSRLAWSAEQVPGRLESYREIMSQKQNKTKHPDVSSFQILSLLLSNFNLALFSTGTQRDVSTYLLFLSQN